MGNIYFTSDLEIQVLKAIKEAYDCADVKNDLDKIQWTIHRPDTLIGKCGKNAP